MKPLLVLLHGMLFFCSTAISASLPAWHYTLLQDSTFLNDCPICGRPSFFEPLRGSFDLLIISNTPASRFAVITNLHFVTLTDPPRTITGHGTIYWNVLNPNQQVILSVDVSGVQKTFTNDVPVGTTLWPMIDTHVTQTPLNLFSNDSMQIVAAPMRELWFATRVDFFSTNAQRQFQAGDLLSKSGRLVEGRAPLLASVGLSSTVALDTVTIAPGGETMFSILSDSSGTNGSVPNGSLLSNQRGTVFSNPGLLAGFAPLPADGDRGLDAAYLNDAGVLYFSTRVDFTSQLFGQISNGDVLAYNPAGAGLPNHIVKTRQQLLAKFNPLDPSFDAGLDALYVWPSGEIWFSTERDFESQSYGHVANGDLLSDQGRIIFREPELLATFAARETNCGLRAIFVVTDAATATNPAPKIASPQIRPGTGDLRLTWESSARVFQVEKAPVVTGPYGSVSEIFPDRTWTDPAATIAAPRSFYRLLAW